jgi:hypothetical protein
VQPKSLSATSGQVYETCPSRWKAEYLDRAPQPSGSAASLGTACHGTLERLVADGYPQDWSLAVDAVERLYEVEYRKVFADNERYDEGLELCKKWVARQDWTGRTVLTTEVKKNFEIPTSIGPLTFNYIMDRCDRVEANSWMADGSEDEVVIEVIDYKTVGLPVQPDDLKKKLQARAYGLAAQIEHPEATRVWVTFDLLRYDAVGCVFTKAENAATWHYLKALAQRIVDDEPDPANPDAIWPAEQLNAECRYCIRNHVCTTLNKHVAAGGVLGITDPHEAADRRAQLAYAKQAFEAMIAELDAPILAYCEAEGINGFATDDTVVEIGAKSTRSIDPQMAARVVGPDVLVNVAGAKPTMKAIDELLRAKDTTLTDEQKSQLRQLINRSFGNPYVQTKPKSPHVA